MFSVYAKGSLIGSTNLEFGDPPMGVALGRFFPLVAYAVVQAEVVSARCGDQAALALSVATPDGRKIVCVGVHIADYSADLGDDGMEISVLGIEWPPYEELFRYRDEQNLARKSEK